jgi:hypothetical protein
MCCDGGGGSNISNDPNVGAAAAKQAAVAEKAEAFGEDYYKNTVAPLVGQMTAQSKQSMEQQNQLFDIQYPMAQAQAEQYKTYGLPAQEKYYQMVQQYSAPEEMERQAQAAQGDVINAQQVQQGNMDRDLAARGVDPTSGMAVAARNQSNILGAASQAAAMSRARNAARQMGMSLTAGAADFASGRPASNIGMFAGGAGNASNGAFGVASGSIGAANQGTSSMFQGYGMAGNAYGSQMQTYGNLASAQAQADAQSSAGLGSMVGALGGAAITVF